MKLAVSNIAWDPAEGDAHLALIRQLGCDGVELAPSCLWPEPSTVPDEQARQAAARIRGLGLEITGFHSLLYTRPDLQLFQDRQGVQETVRYLKRLVRLCAAMTGRVLVFGSPRNRIRHGKTVEECLAWAADAFRQLAEDASGNGVVLCIEPLAPQETEFIQSSEEGMALVRAVGHPNFGLHLDAKAMAGAGEDPDTVLPRYAGQVQHFHVGDAGLAPPGSTGTVDHPRFGNALRRSGYTGYVSIEMRRGFGPSRDVVTRSIAYVREHYLAGSTASVSTGRHP